ncbi:hypothetical protein BGZ92_005922, partial [Podila epicladia]
LATFSDKQVRDAYINNVRAPSLQPLHSVDQPPPLPHVMDLPAPQLAYVPIARRPFTQDLVSGLDVIGGRHTLGPMMSCPHCKARVWLQERSGGSKA